MRLAKYILLAALALTACDRAEPDDPPRPQPIVVIPRLEVEVVRRFMHDSQAYTQGLVYHDGLLYESTGQYGRSTIRVVDPATGAIRQQRTLPANVFGEGLAMVGDTLVQLTWKEFTAYYYDPATLEPVRTQSYTGDGWGLCHDGEHLYMTTGDDKLYVRDPRTFELRQTLQVTRGGQPFAFANELECVGDDIYANIYGSPTIVRLDKRTGEVRAEIDGSTLFPPGVDRGSMDHVLNGIAYNPESGTFFVTGKLWPEMLEVRFR